MGYVKVTPEELLTVSGQLTTAAGNIGTENAHALGLVNGLVGEGWEGAASTQFSVLFDQWNTSAAKLLESLDGISKLLSGAGSAYADTEANIASSMS